MLSIKSNNSIFHKSVDGTGVDEAETHKSIAQSFHSMHSFEHPTPIANIEPIVKVNMDNLDLGSSSVIKNAFQSDVKTNAPHPMVPGFDINNMNMPNNISNIPLVPRAASKVSSKYRGESYQIYNHQRELMGAFKLDHLIKFMSGGNFLTDLDNYEYEKGLSMIKTFVSEDGKQIMNNSSSPFMGNLDMVIRMNEGLHRFKKNRINDQLEKVPEDKIESVTKSFNDVCDRFNKYTLNLINKGLSHHVNIKPSVKTHMLRYSGDVILRMNNDIQSRNKALADRFNQLNTLLEQSQDLKKILLNRMNTIVQSGGNISGAVEEMVISDDDVDDYIDDLSSSERLINLDVSNYFDAIYEM